MQFTRKSLGMPETIQRKQVSGGQFEILFTQDKSLKLARQRKSLRSDFLFISQTFFVCLLSVSEFVFIQQWTKPQSARGLNESS